MRAWTAQAIRGVVALLYATYRVRVHGAEHLPEAHAAQPGVLSFWHEQVMVLGPFLQRQLIRRGVPVTLLASQSKDGELAATLGRSWGAEVVRGSATRGGIAALRGLYRAIRKRGGSPVVIPDGPHGPAYVAKPGAVVLAQLAEVPLRPFAARASRCWRLRSWDRMIVPKPFSRIDVWVGEPLRVAADADEAQLEACTLALVDSLDRLSGRRAAAAPGEALR